VQLGIDIGTDVARAAFLAADGQPRLVRLPDGSTSLPALARQTMHGLQVGQDASRALVGNAETTLVGCTRLMGRAGELPPALIDRLPYPVHDRGGEAVCDLLYAEVRASSVYAALVGELVGAAEAASGDRIDGVVLTVPASAENRFRTQARAAVEAAGIRVARLINQPTAALLAASLPKARHVAVVHCGGGGFEVSLAEHSAAGTRILASAGDPTLGGDDLAWLVADRLGERFRESAGLDLGSADRSNVARAGLRRVAAEALHQLSLAPEMLLVLDHGGGFGRDLATVLRRSDLDAWLEPAMSRLTELCRRVLGSSRLRAGKIDAVLLLGEWAGPAQVRLAIAAAFDRPVGELLADDAATLAVRGAALMTGAQTPLVWDVTPYPLGINCYYGETELFSPIIAANAPIPTPKVGARGAHTERFSTRYPDQTSVRLDVLQYRGPRTPQTAGANRVFPNECEVLGSWTFSDLRPEPGQYVPFEVTFAIDADGILHLQAVEQATGHALAADIANYAE